MALAPDERLLLERSLERVVADAANSGPQSHVTEASASFPREDWIALADLGVISLTISEPAGGLGGSLGDLASVARVLGAGLSPSPYLSCAVEAGRLLGSMIGNPTAAAWVARLGSGEGLYGFAHRERSDRGAAAVRGTKISRMTNRWTLSGSKLLVPHPQHLDGIVVSARDQDGTLHLCLLSPDEHGVQIRQYRTVDGQPAGEITFDNVAVDDDRCWQRPGLDSALDELAAYVAVTAAADSLGCMQELLKRTAAYLNDRKQFGQPLARFQALKHRLVDAYTTVEQAAALLEVATVQNAPLWRARAAAAKAYIDGNAVRLGHEAIQMHGAMGLTDELAISHLHKRVLANAMRYGDADFQLNVLIDVTDKACPDDAGMTLPFDELLTAPEATFRREVRTFLDEELNGDIRAATRRLTCTFADKEITTSWHSRLNAKRWLAPLWPPDLGGTGWSAIEHFLFEYEAASAGAPDRIPMGLRYVGPIVARYGTSWQKEWFLPRILSGEHYWAQGFSEPGAGSDLAAIKTAAELDGDEYVVNGSKIWTTNAHVADWIFCLVRTSVTGKPQEGISFLLIDLRTPGIRIEPIRLLAVDHEVNLVFFDGVRVPARNLVGEPGRGWEYAKFLLELERGGTFACGRVRAELATVREQMRRGPQDLMKDDMWRRRLASLEVRLMALEAHEFRRARAMTHATDPGVGGSLTKLVSSELQQDVTQLGMQVAGLAGLELEARRPLIDAGELGYPGSDLDLVAMPRYLNTRATTIFAGSSEIQREIIAKHVLGFGG